MNNTKAKNLKKAKEVLARYEKLRLLRDEKEAFDLKGKLLSTGYSIEEFIFARDEDYVKKSPKIIKEIDSSIVVQEVVEAHKRTENTCLIITQDKSIVYVGKEDYNKDYCINNNIPVYPIGYNGGTIVAGPKDLTLGLVFDKSNLMDYFKSKLKGWIESNFQISTEIGNDLMIGEYKVVGTATRQTGDKTLYCIQISFDVSLDLIREITSKAMVKIPKGLSDFGTKTNRDLVKEVKTWLQ